MKMRTFLQSTLWRNGVVEREGYCYAWLVPQNLKGVPLLNILFIRFFFLFLIPIVLVGAQSTQPLSDMRTCLLYVLAQGKCIENMQAFVEKTRFSVKTRLHGKHSPLHGAVRTCNSDMVSWLIEQGADGTQEDYCGGRTPLYYAVDKGSKKTVELLYRKFSSKHPGEDLTHAVEKNHADIVDFLLEEGVTDNKGSTLASAARCGNSAFMKKLITKIRYQQWGYGNFYDVCTEKDDGEVIDILVQQGVLHALPHIAPTILERNCAKGHTATVARIMYHRLCAVSARSLELALDSDHESVATILLDNDVLASNRERSEYLLRKALYKSSSALVRKMVMKAASVNEDVLKVAVRRGRYDLFPFLMEYVPIVINPLEQDIDDNSCSQKEMEYRNWMEHRSWVDDSFFGVSYQSKREQIIPPKDKQAPILAIKIGEKNYSSALSVLINRYVKGREISSNIIESGSSSALTWLIDHGGVIWSGLFRQAVQYKKIDFLKILFDHDSSCCSKDELNDFLCECYDIPTAELLIQHGADVHARHSRHDWSPLYHASLGYPSKFINYFLRQGLSIAATKRKRDGETCLHNVPDNLNCLQLLLDHASLDVINDRDNKGNTALHEAAKCYSQRAHCALFIAAGADVNACNQGCTPLDNAFYAMRTEENVYDLADQFKVVMLLKKFGGCAEKEKEADKELDNLLGDIPYLNLM